MLTATVEMTPDMLVKDVHGNTVTWAEALAGLEELKNELLVLEVNKRVLESKISAVEQRVLSQVLPATNPGPSPALTTGYWECDQSPVGVCVYEDYNEDECVFCGEPDERK